jgi:hypothetical protein
MCNTQAKIAIEKRDHPDRFCPRTRCLWRTAKRNHATGERQFGGYCPRHNGAGRAGLPARPSPDHPEVGVDPANHTLIPSARRSQADPPTPHEPKSTFTVMDWIRAGFQFLGKVRPDAQQCPIPGGI